MERSLLTVGEVAEILRVSVKSVYRNIHSIPGAFKVFGTWRFDREKLLTGLKEMAAGKGKGHGDRHGLGR